MSHFRRICAVVLFLACFCVGKVTAEVVPFSGSFAWFAIPSSTVTTAEFSNFTSYGMRTTPSEPRAEILWPQLFGVFMDVPENVDGIVLHVSPSGYVDGTLRVEVGSASRWSAQIFHPTKPEDIRVNFPEDLGQPFGMWWGFTANRYPSDLWVRPVGWSVASPVPEPKVWAAMLVGLIILGIVARRRQEKRARIIA